jgi:hypothetical protein
MRPGTASPAFTTRRRKWIVAAAVRGPSNTGRGSVVRARSARVQACRVPQPTAERSRRPPPSTDMQRRTRGRTSGRAQGSSSTGLRRYCHAPGTHKAARGADGLGQGRRRSSHSPLTGRPHEPQMNCCQSLLSCLSKRNATMNDYDPTSPHETVPARPVSSARSGPPASSPDSSASITMAKQLHRPRVRRLLSSRRSRWVLAGGLLSAVIAACGTSSATATSPSATAAGGGFAGGLASGGGGSNARSGPAAGGASGTVARVSTSGFTMSTSAGQTVTVDEAASTTYQNGTSSTSASAITTGEGVLVLGTTSGTTITATQVIVQPAGSGGSAASLAAGVIPFQRGATTTSKQVGQIPANYSQGSGTIVSGTTANKATEAALAAYPGGVVDRVVQLSNGEYEVHYIGVNWPHHIFVNQDFKVVGAS